jgi:LuxR family transcriptional regulator, positive regulator of biofilm formation
MKYKQLFIWGPNPLGNRLLADHIHFCSGITPTCVCESVELAESAFNADSLFFCDCAQADAKSYCRKIHRTGLALKESPSIVLLNVRRDEYLFAEIRVYPIQGIFYASDRFELIEKGIRQVLAGDYWLSRELLVKSLKAIRLDQGGRTDTALSPLLTMREQEIIRLITAGLSNQAIADRLFISPNTVKTHVSNIYKKIDSTNRVQAINWATEYLHSSPLATEQDLDAEQPPADRFPQ